MPNTGTIRHDWVWYSGFVVITLQLAVATIPWAWRGNWLILLATACGTLLALTGGALPQWKAEKWACRPNSPETYCLLRGNGHQQVIVIESAGMGLNLEDLASSRVPGSSVFSCPRAAFPSLVDHSTGDSLDCFLGHRCGSSRGYMVSSGCRLYGNDPKHRGGGGCT